jgi:phenylalanine-4-hydroxylase
VPLHADPVFADFLQTYGKAALTTDDPHHTERLARLFWFTVEFGLIREGGRNRLYGSGLISSPGESKHALTSKDVDRRPFDLDTVCDTSFEIDHYQPLLFIVEDFEQLYEQVGTLEAWMKAGKLDNVTPGWRTMSEADVDSFLEASLTTRID